MTSNAIRNTEETLWTLFLKPVTMSSQQQTDNIKPADGNSGCSSLLSSNYQKSSL